MTDKSSYSILTDAVALILSHVTYGLRFSNCRLPASTWVEALTKSNHIDSSIIIDAKRFNTAMSRSPLFEEAMQRFDGTNTKGVYRIKFQKMCFYFFTEESRQTCYPCPLNNTVGRLARKGGSHLADCRNWRWVFGSGWNRGLCQDVRITVGSD